jgi:adenosylhomocysteinase
LQDSKIKDRGLASEGELQIEWASKHMPVLAQMKSRFVRDKPFKGLTIAACLHVTKETGFLVETFLAGDAKIAICGSNPLSTQDNVASALAEQGAKVYAWRQQSTEEYYWCVQKTLEHKPDITLDDGADLVGTLHSKMPELLDKVKGGTEETTTGVIRLRAMEKDNALKYPIILRATNILLAGKNFVVCGYGWCGRGIAQRARGMGSKVIVTEVNPTKALEAAMDGYEVMTIQEAAPIGDVFVTATGDMDVLVPQHLQLMRDGAILANSGHFNVEINPKHFDQIATSKRTIRPNLEEYTLRNGRRLYLLAEGRLVNLAAAEGHPSEVMDMSFADQALCTEYLAKTQRLPPKVYPVPAEIDETVAKLKLAAMKITIDKLTPQQIEYLSTWKSGTT